MDLPTIIFWIGVLFLIIHLWGNQKANVWRYDYLKVLTYKWKDGEDIKAEMEEIVGRQIDDEQFHMSMLALVEEHLAEREFRPNNLDDYTLGRIVYRITDEGGKKLREPWRENPPVIPLPEGT